MTILSIVFTERQTKQEKYFNSNAKKERKTESQTKNCI